MRMRTIFGQLVLVIFLSAALACGSKNKAEIRATKDEMKSVKSALKAFNKNAKRYPTTEEGLKALITKPEGLTPEQWPDKYLNAEPVDAWGKEFVYKCPSEHGKKYDL